MQSRSTRVCFLTIRILHSDGFPFVICYYLFWFDRFIVIFCAKMKNVNTTINIYEYNNNMSSPSNARHRRMVALRGIRDHVYIRIITSLKCKPTRDGTSTIAIMRTYNHFRKGSTLMGVWFSKESQTRLSALTNIFSKAENISDRNDKNVQYTHTSHNPCVCEGVKYAFMI